MVREEVFDIAVTHQGQVYNLKVKADLPAGPEPFGSDYDIYAGRKHIYTLNQCRNEDGFLCWEIKKKPKDNHDPELAHAIGAAIDRHYK